MASRRSRDGATQVHRLQVMVVVAELTRDRARSLLLATTRVDPSATLSAKQILPELGDVRAAIAPALPIHAPRCERFADHDKMAEASPEQVSFHSHALLARRLRGDHRHDGHRDFGWHVAPDFERDQCRMLLR